MPTYPIVYYKTKTVLSKDSIRSWRKGIIVIKKRGWPPSSSSMFMTDHALSFSLLERAHPIRDPDESGLLPERTWSARRRESHNITDVHKQNIKEHPKHSWQLLSCVCVYLFNKKNLFSFNASGLWPMLTALVGALRSKLTESQSGPRRSALGTGRRATRRSVCSCV